MHAPSSDGPSVLCPWAARPRQPPWPHHTAAPAPGGMGSHLLGATAVLCPGPALGSALSPAGDTGHTGVGQPQRHRSCCCPCGHLRPASLPPGSHGPSVSIIFFFFFVFLSFSRATPVASGGSQARGRIRGVAAGLHQSHSKARSQLSLRPSPQLMATPDP